MKEQHTGRFLCFALALLAVLAPGLQAQPPAGSNPDDILKNARARLEGRDFAGALALLEPLGKTFPPSVEALSLLGALYLQLDRPADALAVLEAHTSDPDADPRLIFHAARAALALGREEQGEKLLIAAVGRAPASFAAVRLAELRATQGASAEVVKLLQPFADGELASSIALRDPSLAARLAWLQARAFLDLQKPARALGFLEHLSELETSDDSVWQLLGETLVEVGEIDRAQTALTRAQTLREQRLSSENAARENREHVQEESSRLLAQAFEQHNAGQLEEALASLRGAIALSSDNPRPRLLEVRLLSELRRDEEALLKADALARDRPKDPEPLHLRGMIQLNLKHFAKAEHDLRQVLAMKPDHRGGLNGLAMVMMVTDRWQEAEEVLKGLLQSWPDDELAQRNLIKVRQRLAGG